MPVVTHVTIDGRAQCEVHGAAELVHALTHDGAPYNARCSMERGVHADVRACMLTCVPTRDATCADDNDIKLERGHAQATDTTHACTPAPGRQLATEALISSHIHIYIFIFIHASYRTDAFACGCRERRTCMLHAATVHACTPRPLDSMHVHFIRGPGLHTFYRIDIHRSVHLHACLHGSNGIV